MNMIGDVFTWLFTDQTGVLCLVGGGILLFLLISLVLERRTKKRYYNHEKSEGDWDLFDDAENGWSDFDEDNK